MTKLSVLLKKHSKLGEKLVNKKYGSKAWSSMVVKRLEDICKINFRANGYPEELVDNEKEEKGYEI